MATKRMSGLSKQVESYLRLKDKPKPLQLLYATSNCWPLRSPPSDIEQDRPQIDIGVLDSSFNPPQAAHFALATGKKPLTLHQQNPKQDYDAILLLFSVKNADKGTGTSKDASPEQRLHMMQLMAKDLEQEANSNVAVGMVEEPLMYSKSTLIHDYIREEGDKASIRLHWLVGFDTLQRFFQVKYYPSPDFFAEACQTFFRKERTTFVCARRGLESQPNKVTDASSRSQSEEEAELLQSELVKPWVDEGSVMMLDLDEDVQGVSSTAIRRQVSEPGRSQEQMTKALSRMTTPRVAEYLVDPNTNIYGK